MPIKLLLIRHFPTEWNIQGLYQGRCDIALSKGSFTKLQNLTIDPKYGSWPTYSSPLLRAFQTAKELSPTPPQVVDALTEIQFGEWEGKSIQQTRQTLKQTPPRFGKWGWQDRPPGGESYQEVWARLQPFLNSLDRDSILVTHRGVIITCIAKAWGWDIESKAPAKIDPNLSHLLEYNRSSGQMSVQELNVISLLKK